MAGTTVRKLVVEVVEARDLLPKDGAGTSSPYVVVDFDGQRKRTQTVHRDLNPGWNEVLVFDVGGGGGGGLGRDMAGGEPLEIDVMHDRRVGPSRRNNFLGRVRLDSGQLVRKGEEALVHYPLQKKSFFSWIRGDIGLKIYYVDEPVPAPPPPPAAEGQKSDESVAAPQPEAEKSEETGSTPTADPTAATETTTDTEKQAGEPAAPPPATEQTQPVEPPPDAAANFESAPEATPETEPPPPPADNASNLENPQELDPPSEDATADAVKPPGGEAPPPPPADELDAGDPLPPLDQENEEIPEWTPRPQPKPIPRRSPAAAERTAEGGIERSSFDLVEKMQYLFVRVVRARSLPAGAKPHVKIAVSGRQVSTGIARRTSQFFDWDQTFAFAREGGQNSANTAADSDPAALEVSVWDLPPGSDAVAAGKHFLGGVCFDVSEVPTRDPPDSPLALQWYRLEGGGGRLAGGGDLMLATWVGTQADESFHDAWKADAPRHVTSRSKVYLSPKLWYLRVTILEAQDLPLTVPSREAAVSVRATLGFQSLRTRAAVGRNGSPSPPSWNEDLLFVAAEPFGDQTLLLSLETRHGKETSAVFGSAGVPLSSVERRVDDRKVASRWLDLLLPPTATTKKGATLHASRCGRLHVRVCLDGGYHVAEEPAHACSDYRPSARQLWRPPIGTLELGIIGCQNLLPMKTVPGSGGRGSTDAYAVAKYGPKWARTRTVADSFDPTWNEQYTWPVHDPCTVLTVGVFDESPPSDDPKDATCHRIGRVRIRLSALESGRAYRSAHPLHLLLPSGLKKMGEIELAVRFSRAGSALDLLHVYGQPTLPPMHFIRPIGAAQREQLRTAAARFVAAHLARSEPSLKKEAVMYVLDAEQQGFSMRKVRANWHRAVAALSWLTNVARWMEDTRAWRNPTATMLAHGVLVLLVWYPDLIVSALALHVSAVGVWKYRKRPRGADSTVCARASQLEGAAAVAEELDEEFDTTPSGRGYEVVRARYDRLRSVAARVQGVLGDVAAQGERVQALVTWRDPRATGIFVGSCLLISAVLLVVPSKIVAVALGFYWLRHPMFRDRAPPAAVNFFRRLPSLSDRMM